MKLVVGLGNPGPSYARTRHNVGFLVVDELAVRHGVRFRSGRDADTAHYDAIRLMKPTTMMNLSGRPVLAAMAHNGIAPSEVLVIHDDLDLPLGRLRFKAGGGGSGGARGVESIITRIGSDFPRLKLGIGRPPQDRRARDWVLSHFSEGEAPLLELTIGSAVEAVELLLQDGLDAAMNWANGLNLSLKEGAEGTF